MKVESRNDKGENLEVKSNKCTTSPSKSNKFTASSSKLNKCTASPSKSNKCTASHQCDKTSTTPKSKSDEKKVSDSIESHKDEAYEHMKSNLFIFLREKIPFGRDDLDEIQYYPFVQHHKLQFVKKLL